MHFTAAEIAEGEKRRKENRILCTFSILWMCYVIVTQTFESIKSIEEYKHKAEQEAWFETENTQIIINNLYNIKPHNSDIFV